MRTALAFDRPTERLDVAEILTLDSDFDVYRRFRREPFCRVPLG